MPAFYQSVISRVISIPDCSKCSHMSTDQICVRLSGFSNLIPCQVCCSHYSHQRIFHAQHMGSLITWPHPFPHSTNQQVHSTNWSHLSVSNGGHPLLYSNPGSLSPHPSLEFRLRSGRAGAPLSLPSHSWPSFHSLSIFLLALALYVWMLAYLCLFLFHDKRKKLSPGFLLCVITTPEAARLLLGVGGSTPAQSFTRSRIAELLRLGRRWRP